MHAEGQLLLRVLVELLSHCERLSNHLALLYPLRFIVTPTNDPGKITNYKSLVGTKI